MSPSEARLCQFRTHSDVPPILEAWEFDRHRRIRRSILRLRSGIGLAVRVAHHQTISARATERSDERVPDPHAARRRTALTIRLVADPLTQSQSGTSKEVPLSAACFCTREVDVIMPEESVQTAAGRMHGRKVGTLVVVDTQRSPIGIITDRDICVRLVAAARDPVRTPVSDVMTPAPETVRERSALEDALRKMRAGAFRRLPVVNDHNRLVGLLSLDDVLRVLAHDFAQIERLIDHESPRSLIDTSDSAPD